MNSTTCGKFLYFCTNKSPLNHIVLKEVENLPTIQKKTYCPIYHLLEHKKTRMNKYSFVVDGSRMDAQYDGMEFFLTTPQQSDNSYEEKRKYLKRRSHETDEPPANKKTMADVTPMVNI